MLAYQVDYWKLQEQKRANRANEALGWANVAIGERNATANERNAATNERNAQINAFNAQVNARNADVNAYNAQTNRLNYFVNQQNADTRMKEYELTESWKPIEIGIKQQEADAKTQQAEASSTTAKVAKDKSDSEILSNIAKAQASTAEVTYKNAQTAVAQAQKQKIEEEIKTEKHNRTIDWVDQVTKFGDNFAKNTTNFLTGLSKEARGWFNALTKKEVNYEQTEDGKVWHY